MLPLGLQTEKITEPSPARVGGRVEPPPLFSDLCRTCLSPPSCVSVTVPGRVMQADHSARRWEPQRLICPSSSVSVSGHSSCPEPGHCPEPGTASVSTDTLSANAACLHTTQYTLATVATPHRRVGGVTGRVLGVAGAGGGGLSLAGCLTRAHAVAGRLPHTREETQRSGLGWNAHGRRTVWWNFDLGLCLL